MTHPCYALHNIPAAAYANRPSSANATFPAFTESEVDCIVDTLLNNSGARALAAPRVAPYHYHHTLTPIATAYPAASLGGTPSAAGSTPAGAFDDDDETEERQALLAHDAPSPASSELFGNLFGDDSDDDDDDGEVETLGVIPTPSDAKGLSSNFGVTSEFPGVLGAARVGISHNPLPVLLEDERPPPTTSYSFTGINERGRQELYNLEAAPQSLDPTAYHHLSWNQYQYQEREHPAAFTMMPMVSALPSLGAYVYNTPATQPAYESPAYPTNAIRPHHPSTVVAGPSHKDTSHAAAEVSLLSAKTAGKRRTEHNPEPTIPSQEHHSTAFTHTAESWQLSVPPSSSGSQGLNKRKRGDDDEIDGHMSRPAPFHEGVPSADPSTCDQDFYRFTEPEHGLDIVDLRNHQGDFCQGGQQQASTSNLASVEEPTAPVCRGDPSLIGFSQQELQLWLEATEAYYQYPLEEAEEIYMLARPLIVTTRQLIGAFSEFQWPGPETCHIYRGFNWYPVPPGMGCINSYLGIRVGVFQNSGTSEFRYIPLDIERNQYTTIDEFYYHLMRVNKGVYWIHSRRLVDVTHLSGGLSANKPFREAIPRKP